MTGIDIIATGKSIPSNVLSNDDMRRFVDTSDEWITTRTGIKQRCFCDSGETTITLAVDASAKAIEKAGVDKSQIGVCIVATFTPEYAAPSTACLVQAQLGLGSSTLCFDLNAACSGFLYALETARSLLFANDKKYALVIGSEKISNILDLNDRGTCVLFGDGAGAAVVQLKQAERYYSVFGSNGDIAPLSAHARSDYNFLKMDGQTVFRFAVDAICNSIKQVCANAGCNLDEIDWFICHQANARIIDFAAKRLDVPIEKFYKNIDKYGNTSAASIPIVIDEMTQQNLLQKGQDVICVGFGAGLAWGATLLTY